MCIKRKLQIKIFKDIMQYQVLGYFPSVEPVSGAPPKLTSGDKVRTSQSSHNASATLMCPAQGFPVPSYRLDYLNLPKKTVKRNIYFYRTCLQYNPQKNWRQYHKTIRIEC